MNKEIFTKLLQINEFEKLDFKRDWYKDNKYDDQEIIKDIIGLANGGPSHVGETAFLIIGVKDTEKRKILFDVFIEKPMLQLKKEIIQNINNYAYPAITNIDMFNFNYLGKNIVIIEIRQHPYIIQLKKDLRLPRYRQGDVLYRIKESTEVAPFEIQKEIRKKISKFTEYYSKRGDNTNKSIDLIDEWFEIISSKGENLFTINPCEGTEMIQSDSRVDLFIQKLMAVGNEINIDNVIRMVNEKDIIEKYESYIYYAACMDEELEMYRSENIISQSIYDEKKLIYPRIKSTTLKKIKFLKRT